MDDRQAQFFTLIGEASNSARLASLRIVLRLQDGSEVAGILTVDAAQDDTELDDTGFEDRLQVGGMSAPLHEVSAFTVLRPA